MRGVPGQGHRVVECRLGRAEVAPIAQRSSDSSDRRDATSCASQPGLRQLFDEQQHATGLAMNGRDRVGVGCGQPALDDLARGHLVEGRQGELPLPVAAVERIAEGPQRHNGAQALQVVEHARQQLARCIVSPLPVVDQQQQRRLHCRGTQPLVQVVARRCRRASAVEHLGKRVQRPGARLVGAIAVQHAPPSQLRQRGQFIEPPAIAHTRRADEVDAAPATGRLRCRDSRRQRDQHIVTPGERRQTRAYRGVQATSAGRPRGDRRGPDGRGAAQQCQFGLRAECEVTRVCAQRIEIGQHGTRRCELRQPRGRVSSVADDVVAAALDVAVGEQHDTAVKPRMNLQRTQVVGQRRPVLAVDFLLCLERGRRRAEAIVFGGHRQAEDRQHAVTLGADDAPAMALDGVAADAAQACQNGGELLRLKALCQAARRAQIHEQQREVAALTGCVQGGAFRHRVGKKRPNRPTAPILQKRRRSVKALLARRQMSRQ